MVTLDRKFLCQSIYSVCSFFVLALAIVIAYYCFDIRENHLGGPIEIDGAQLIGLDWEKLPFVETSVVTSEQNCPNDEEMVYDIWLGLFDSCFCQEGSSLESVKGEGGCRGKTANSPYCRSRPPINPVIRNNLNGYKICGKRAGSNFLSTVRPKSPDGVTFACPTGYEPCGDPDALTNGKQESVICAVDTSTECPITSINLDFDPSGFAKPVVNNSKEPDNLPLANFKFSTSTPCLDWTKEPSSAKGSITEELTYTEEDAGCTVVNESYKEITTTNLSLKQGKFEDNNKISPILQGRYFRNDIDNYDALKLRAENDLKIY